MDDHRFIIEDGMHPGRATVARTPDQVGPEYDEVDLGDLLAGSRRLRFAKFRAYPRMNFERELAVDALTAQHYIGGGGAA